MQDVDIALLVPATAEYPSSVMGGFILISTWSTGSNGAALTNLRKASVSAFCSGVNCGGWFCASAGVEMRTTIIANTEKRTTDIWKSSPFISSRRFFEGDQDVAQHGAGELDGPAIRFTPPPHNATIFP